MKHFPILFCTLLVFNMAAQQAEKDEYEGARQRMVLGQIKARGVTDNYTLKAMNKVPRHKFVPSGLANSAYNDSPLPIGYDQTISQPYMVAFMTQQIRPKKDFRVLEIGTGSGYQTAILSEIVDSVFTIEIVEELYITAKKRLEELNYENVSLKFGDGYQGWPEKGPFDGIIVTAAADSVPPALIDQLREGGRMIIPIGKTNSTQQLMEITKKNGKVSSKNLMLVRFVPFTRSNN